MSSTNFKNENERIKEGEYFQKGDYHREIDTQWRYFPVYKAKMDFIDQFMQSMSRNATFLDAGCGEGVLVEKYRGKGYTITGLDLNYASDYVCKGSILDMPFADEEFDVVLCLDVIEHLHFEEQGAALIEVKRVLKKGGMVVLALPNLAHIASRISFLLKGSLIRTSSIDRHKGDRPINEYLQLIKDSNFISQKRKGIFPTFPIISALTYYYPEKVGPIHSIYNSLLSYPNWCFLNIVICKKMPFTEENSLNRNRRDSTGN